MFKSLGRFDPAPIHDASELRTPRSAPERARGCAGIDVLIQLSRTILPSMDRRYCLLGIYCDRDDPLQSLLDDVKFLCALCTSL